MEPFRRSADVSSQMPMWLSQSLLERFDELDMRNRMPRCGGLWRGNERQFALA